MRLQESYGRSERFLNAVRRRPVFAVEERNQDGSRGATRPSRGCWSCHLGPRARWVDARGTRRAERARACAHDAGGDRSHTHDPRWVLAGCDGRDRRRGPRGCARSIGPQPLLVARLHEARRSRVLQSHGRADPLLPFAIAESLNRALADADASATFVPFAGGHEIPQTVVNRLAAFARERLATG